MSILTSPLQSVLSSPLSSPLLSGSMWWLAFGQNASFAYDLPNNRYMRSGGASTQALSLTEDRASSAMVLQGNGAYVERAAGELAIGQGVGLQVSQAVTNLFLNPTLQGHTSWIAGGDGDCDLTANAGLDPTGAQVATVVENQSAHNFGSQFYQGVAIVDTEMTISLWAYADEDVAGTLKLNDNENNLNVTIGTAMQRFDHTGTIGPALLGGGIGRCGFQSGENWQGKGVVIAWIQINVGGPAPFAVGTRAADNPLVVPGIGGLPYPGYNPEGTVSGYGLVEGGGFDTQEDVDLWVAQAATLLSLSAGTMRVENVGANYGGSAQAVPVKTGRVYALSGERSDKSVGAGAADCHLGGAGSHDRYVSSGQWANGPFYSLVEEASVNISATVGGNGAGAWKEHDNISLQEVEPGVVIEAVGVWGSTDGQHAFYLKDAALDNRILIRRTSAGTVKLVILVGGVTIMDTGSSTAWPDDDEGTFRLELTNTDGGCFAAIFLDDVFVIGSDAFDYPHAINQLDLSPVAGVKIIEKVFAK